MNSDEYIGETPLPLLNQAQSFLGAQLQRQAPDSVMTAAWDEWTALSEAIEEQASA